MNEEDLLPEDQPLDVEELDDGSATVSLPPEEEAGESDFYSNLVDEMDDFELNTLASDLDELITLDKQARAKRDEQYEEGLKRTGLGDDAPGGASFNGAATAVHPVLAEGCVDFAARAIKETFPAGGPVKTRINRQKVDDKALDRAKRKRDYLNWQCTRQIKEYRPEREVLYTQLPLGGSQFLRFWPDLRLKRPRVEFVPVDKVLLPYAAVSFDTATRFTYMEDVTEAEFEARVASGFYADVITPIQENDVPKTRSEEANDKIEGRSLTGYNEDGVRVVYMINITRQIGEDDAPRPYIVHLDEPTNKVLAVYRNWKEDDEQFEKLEWWTEDKFIPWRGAYGVGLLHLIGSLAGSATGALRALLDSAHINNSPGAVKLKGGRASGGNTEVAVTEIKEIDAPPGVDDIRKVMMPLPFNPPSTVLFQLLDWITNQAKGVVATAEEKIQDASNNMPVGTALALIEQGSQVFSAIHGRLHASQARALQIICRLNHDYPDEQAMARFGVTPEDFADNDDIEPVSDPNIFSEAQRFAQLQGVQQLRAQFQNLQWSDQAIAHRGLELLRVDDPDSFLPKAPEAVTADPVTENVQAMEGTPLKAGVDQDHLAHLACHLNFIVNPIHAVVAIPMPQLGQLYSHVQDHLNMFYQVTCAASAADVHVQVTEPMTGDQIAARASAAASQTMQQVLEPYQQLFQQAGIMVQKKMPPPQFPPEVQATMQAAQADTASKEKIAMAQLNLEQQQAQQKAQQEAMQTQLKQAIAQAEQARLDSDQRFQQMMDQMEQQRIHDRADWQAHVDMMNSRYEADKHAQTEELKNTQDNITAILVEKLKLIGDANAQLAQKVEESTKQPQQSPVTVSMGDTMAPLIEALNAQFQTMGQHLQAQGEGIAQLHRLHSAPKTIIRDAQGRAVGIQPNV